jgi:hypothetical protein
VYNIATQKIITRDQFKVCPMPDSVIIKCLNSQAVAEGRKLNTAHMHVFDELLNSRKLIGPNVPSYFTPPLMQDAKDQADPEPFPLSLYCNQYHWSTNCRNAKAFHLRRGQIQDRRRRHPTSRPVAHTFQTSRGQLQHSDLACGLF